MNFEPYESALKQLDTVRVVGRVVKLVGLVIEAQVQGVSIGDVCMIEVQDSEMIRGEVVGFKEDQVLMMPLGPITGIHPGSKVYPTGNPITVKVGPQLLGRVLDGLGDPIDQKGPLEYDDEYPIDEDAPDPISRPRISEC